MEPMFLGELLLKIAVTASVVVAASIVVERTGPFIGAMIASLPTSVGAAYAILALEHSPSFIADSTLGTIAANGAVALFALTYAWLARRHGLVLSLGASLVLWIGCAAVLRTVAWTLPSVLIFGAAIYAFTIAASAPLRRETPPRAAMQPRRFDIPLRALTVGIFVAAVTALSHTIGSTLSGMLAIFPIAMASFVIILHPRVGGVAASSVFAHAQWPLIGLVLGFAVVNLLAERAGVWWAMAAGLLVCLAWNVLLLVLHQARARRVVSSA